MKATSASLLTGQHSDILACWMNLQLNHSSLRQDLMSNNDLQIESGQLLQVILDVIGSSQNTLLASREKALQTLNDISLTRAANGYSPRETARFVFSLKEALTDSIQKVVTDPVTLYAEIGEINRLIDDFALTTFESYAKGREAVIFRQTSEITEISTPVIQVWDGILALPIIGTLDSARTEVVLESLLLKIVETDSTVAILDISGVPAIDSLVAQRLMKTVAAARLMGAECIISGIRPEIAQTIVHLGIDLSNIITKSSLAFALREAFTAHKLEVRKIDDNTKATAY